jgi:hemerythrin-like domain-containing protein
MKPTLELSREHEAIKAMLRIVGKVCDRIDAGTDVEPDHLDRIVEFIQVFGDKCHHAKEEDRLFPAMAAAGVPVQGGPIGVMLIEHTKGREYVRAAKDAIPGYRAKDKSAARKVTANARGYAALLGPHIDKEDHILYPIADRVLSPETQHELEREFARIEEEIVGRGVHERFHALLEELAALYI